MLKGQGHLNVKGHMKVTVKFLSIVIIFVIYVLRGWYSFD